MYQIFLMQTTIYLVQNDIYDRQVKFGNIPTIISQVIPILLNASRPKLFSWLKWRPSLFDLIKGFQRSIFGKLLVFCKGHTYGLESA